MDVWVPPNMSCDGNGRGWPGPSVARVSACVCVCVSLSVSVCVCVCVLCVSLRLHHCQMVEPCLRSAQSQGRLWWRFVEILTGKTFVVLGEEGQRLFPQDNRFIRKSERLEESGTCRSRPVLKL